MTTQPHAGRRPLVAARFGARCPPVVDLVRSATGLCDLLWLVDGRLPETADTSALLGRFGPVVDVGGEDPARLAEALRRYGVAGLVTYHDAGMVELARLAELLGLPFHSPGSAVALVDKARQRALLQEAGLAVPRCAVVPAGPAAAALQHLEPHPGWPAVLKPRSAQGSRHTFLARSSAEAAELLERLGPDREEMVIEDFLPDDPARVASPYAGYVSVESVVAGGRISHLAVTGRFPVAESFRETGFFIPAVLAPEETSAILDLAAAAAEALGVRTGCLHTEVKLTPGGPRLIEVNGRAGGGVPEMLERAAGFDLLALTLRIALGEAVALDGPLPTARIGYRFFLQPPPLEATVRAVEGVERLVEHPGVDAVSIHQGPGASIDWRDGSRNYIVAVVGSARHQEELLAVARLLNEEVRVEYTDAAP